MGFEAIQGQDEAVTALRRSLENGRLAHALLFTGPEGVGKRATALALAQALVCTERKGGDACGHCPACRRAEHGNHPDVNILEPDGPSLKIDQIRDRIQHTAYYKSMEGRAKVYILDAAETLTLEAANSLLKLLEEPPPSVVLILVTSQPFSLLETIRSRCREVRFHVLAPELLASWLQTRLSLSEAEAKALARLSGGRPAEALRLTDPAFQTLRQDVLTWVREARPGQWPALAARLGEYRAELPEALMVLQSWYRDAVLLSRGAARALVVNGDHLDELDAFLRADTPRGLERKLQSVLDAGERLNRNVNLQLVLETLWMDLTETAAVA